MKRAFVFFLAAVFSLSLSAQTKSKQVDITWGKEIKSSKKSTLADIVGFDESGFYALTLRRGWSSKITLGHYNQGLGLVKEDELDLEEQGKDTQYETIRQLNKQLFLFKSFINKKTRKNYLFVQQIDKAQLRPAGEPKMIAEIDFEGNSKRNAGDFGIILSRDSSKVMVYYNMPYDKGENEKFGFHIFNDQMEVLWEKQVTLPYNDELFEIIDYEVDNNGNAYVFGKVYKGKRRDEVRGEANYRFEILSYHDKGNEFRLYPVELDDLFLTDMQIVIDDESNIICAGFYSEHGSQNVSGSYFLKVDSRSKDVVSKATKKFPMNFITRNMTEREKRKTKRKEAKGKSTDLLKFDLDEIILRDDGGAVLVGEQYFVDVVTTTYSTGSGGMTTTTTYYYHYNDIIAVSMNGDGTIDWASKIAKRQTSVNDGGYYSSYALAVVDNKLHFIFNDNPKNLYYKGSGKVYDAATSGKELLVVLCTIDEHGEMTREALFNRREAEIITRPKVCEQVKKNELILYGEWRKNYKFARIVF